MPAYRLDDSLKRLSRFDVIGTDSEMGTLGFIQHVSLVADEKQTAEHGSQVRVTHMRPPLVVGDMVKAHVVGSVGLTTNETALINLFLDVIEKEIFTNNQRSLSSQYIVFPHASGHLAGPGGTTKYHKFSCAGLVVEAYRAAGLKLINTSHDSLPMVNALTIALQYDFPMNGQVAHRLGLSGPGPWPILLPGYILHSLNREKDEIRSQPYTAKPGDEIFT